MKRHLLPAILVVASLALAACSNDTTEDPAATGDASPGEADDSASSTSAALDADDDQGVTAGTETPEPSDTNYLASYTLEDAEFGTAVTVTVDGDTRTIVTNALPDHETGEFPNDGNPNEITAQDLTWEFPVEPTFTGIASAVRTSGVALNGVKFEPGTGESVTCDSGETYRIEAIQDIYDLGLDFNNAHVQPGGEYHYHGISQLLVDGYDNDRDLVLVGFAADGHLIYYSKSGAYSSSYQVTGETRSGTGCLATGPDGVSFDIEGTTADGTYTSDYAFDASFGDLDECMGTTVDGEYVYIATDEFPFVTRCLMGEAADGTGAGGGGTPPAGSDDGEGPPDAPDFLEAANALGITEDELVDALGDPPDLRAAAETLGITLEELEAVLPAPPGA